MQLPITLLMCGWNDMAESIMTPRLWTDVSDWICTPQNSMGAVLS